MLIPRKILLMAGVTLALACGVVHADDLDLDGFAITVAGGIVSIDQDGTFDWTSDETDSLVQSNSGDWDFWTAQVGLDYIYELRDLDDEDCDDLQWFPTLIPQLNLYYIDGGSLEGDVHRFQDAYYNDATYSMDYDSTRLMFDLALTIASVEDWSLYALGGIGVAWNSTDLNVTPNEDADIYGLSLNDNESSSFAYELGAGLNYALTDDIGISLEYLYADLGDVEVEGSSPRVGSDDDDDDKQFNVESSDVDITSQSVLLGINFAL